VTTPGGAVRTRLWSDGVLRAENFPLEDVAKHLREQGALVWVDLCNPDQALLTALAAELGLDERAVEDVDGQRTKAARYATHSFLTVYATGVGPIIPGDIESRLLTARISIIVLPAAMVTVRHENDPLRTVFDIDEVVHRWDDNSDLLSNGSPELLHELLDVVVDEHFVTIQELDDAIESLEDNLFDDTGDNRTIQRNTYRLRKELVELRRIVLPMREVVNSIRRSATAKTDDLYDDLYDNVIRAGEWTESLRDMITTVFETNLSLQDARLNIVVKKLTGWAAIIAVPTLVTGWYGQNIPYPGFGQVSGLVTSALLSVITSVVLFVMFKRRGWI